MRLVRRDPAGVLRLDQPGQALIEHRFREISDPHVIDINTDGLEDIVFGFGAIVQQPDQSFRQFSVLPEYGTGNSAGAMDLNADGLLDAFIAYDGFSGGKTKVRVMLQSPPTFGPCRADMNADGVVDMDDLQLFVASFVNQTGPADTNRDRYVDFTDIQEFVNRYLDGC